MRTAFECFQHAARCETKARGASNQADRQALEKAAQHWRMLGEHAKAVEARKPGSQTGGPLTPAAAVNQAGLKVTLRS